MLTIGSLAAISQGVNLGRMPNDMDFICTFEQFQEWTKNNKGTIKSCQPLSDTKFHVLTVDGRNVEFEIAWEGTAARQLLDIYEGQGVASVDWLYALKMSHRYLKNSTHFLKTMRDIKILREHISPDAHLIIESDWYKLRESQTYVYSHPKLDVSKKEFFTDDVPYIYSHDTIHEAVALGDRPAYTHYLKDGSEVMTSKDKFFSVSEEIRLHGVYEEVATLALERSQIPFSINKEGGPTPRQSFLKALEKVCTSITSGWFRQWAYDNYDKVVDLYEQMGEDDFVQRFLKNQHLLKPFEGK
jgi:hypothetical protein